MEQGNCLDSTLMSARQEVDVRSGDELALDAAITGLLMHPSDGTSATQPQTASSPLSESTDMASACIEQVKRLDAWDANSGSLTEEEGDAEMGRWNALFRRMIDTPSTSLRDLAGKAHLMQADLDRFEPLRPNPSADELLMRVILAETMRFGGLLGTPTVGISVRRNAGVDDPMLAIIEEGRRLLHAYLEAHETFPQDPTTIDPPPEWVAAGRHLWAHIDRTILKTVPRTAVGCRELARFAEEYFESTELPISDDETAVLRLIAQSPLLTTGPEPAGHVDEQGFVTYEDAAGTIHRKTVADWVSFTAQRLSAVARSEMTRQFNAQCCNVSERERVALEDRLRRELRVDALHDLAFRSDRVFEACKEYAVGGRWDSQDREARTQPLEAQAKRSAEEINLSELSITELCVFYETLGAAEALWNGVMSQPLAVAYTSPQGFVLRTNFGKRADFEDNRIGFLRDRIATEVTGRTPADRYERNGRLALRIQQEVACEGSIKDDALLAEIAKVWG